VAVWEAPPALADAAARSATMASTMTSERAAERLPPTSSARRRWRFASSPWRESSARLVHDTAPMSAPMIR